MVLASGNVPQSKTLFFVRYARAPLPEAYHLLRVFVTTEYFKFSDEDVQVVLRDLQRMELKELSQVEINILDSKPA